MIGKDAEKLEQLRKELDVSTRDSFEQKLTLIFILAWSIVSSIGKLCCGGHFRIKKIVDPASAR